MHPIHHEALTEMSDAAFTPNSAVDRPAGSHSLAAAGHRER
jgi:hypothetical protein